MDVTLTLIIVILAISLGLQAWILLRQYRHRQDSDTPQLDTTLQLLKAELISKQAQSLMDMRESIDSANRIINERLAEGTSALDRRMSVLGDIENKLGQLSEQTTNIEDVGRNIQSLSELLRPPRARGKVGELLLENLLSQVLPRSLFETQYCFADGLRVDAIVRLGGKLLPIDAKFPLESFERLVTQPDDKTARREFDQTFKRHVDDISTKYIRPDQNTTDFAVIYIPAEAVYYQYISQEDGSAFDYALSKHVVPSSPGHLYAFLASVAAIFSEINLAQATLEKGGRWLVNGINELSETSVRMEKLHERMQGSLRALSSGFEKARSELRNIRLQLEKLREPAGSDEIEAKDFTAEETIEETKNTP